MDDPRYSTDTITIEGDDPGVVERLNDILESDGQGRPLGAPDRTYGTRAVVPVAGADPRAVTTTLRAAGAPADPRREAVFFNGTLTLAGKDIGHAYSYAELKSNVTPPPRPPWTPPAAGLRRPVIALLDSGVQDHSWFPHPPADDTANDPFVLYAEDPGLDHPWVAPVEEGKGDDPDAGHATFIAGLIRFASPVARVLSVRVMSGQGMVKEPDVVRALQWLEGYRALNPVDVLLMAFGRQPDDESDPQLIDQIEAPLSRLATAGLSIVASAGNDHQCEDPIYPSSSPHVTSVGAGFGDYYARFSNYGDWVDRYREGVSMLSVMPGEKWARWGGTSFSAADFAADLARPRVV